MKRKTNILHLTDLHFGIEAKPEVDRTSTLLSHRENTLNGIIQALGKIECEWKPDIVVVSGDIGWRGSKNDYDAAKEWLDKLRTVLGIDNTEIMVCAGNHDIDRHKTKGMGYPTNAQQADEWLEIEALPQMSRPFDGFIDFCNALGVQKLRVGVEYNHLVGSTEILGLRFVALNSSWFCRGEDDKGNLWIGLPHLQVLNAHGQLVNPSLYDTDTITIGVLHHPTTYLADGETNTYSRRPNTYRYLAERTHILLSGHTHGGVELATRQHDRAFAFTGGATYGGSGYHNTFTIIQIDSTDRTATTRSFEFDTAYEEWRAAQRDSTYDLRSSKPLIQNTSMTSELPEEVLLQTAILRAKEYAARYVQLRSEATATTVGLPDLMDRNVYVQNREERVKRHKGQIEVPASGISAPLSNVVQSSYPSFLLGELGSGKSTLLGQYTAKVCDMGMLGLILPAGHFRGYRLDTLKQLLDGVDDFARQQLIYDSRFDLHLALRSQKEIVLILDGFDELDYSHAVALLHRGNELNRRFPTLTLVASGRPIELKGLNYGGWQILSCSPLTDEEQYELLLNDAKADGLIGTDAERDANTRLRHLKSVPSIVNVASTPLVVRLLRPLLLSDITQQSIGALLYQIIKERIGNWVSRSGKLEARIAFSSVYPNATSREHLVGMIANAILSSPTRRIRKEIIYAFIEAECKSHSNSAVIASEGTDFFANSLLQPVGEEYEFSLQPLYECAVAIYLLDQIKMGNIHKSDEIDIGHWRICSFAAAIARLKGSLSTILPILRAYIEQQFASKGVWATPCAAFIVAESQETSLAQCYVDLLTKLPFRPLRSLFEDRYVAESAIAQSLYLAGDDGFNWFYDAYLDPKYPVEFRGSSIISSIFNKWIALYNFIFDVPKLQKLQVIAQSHIAIPSVDHYHLLPPIALVSPESFTMDQRIQLLVRLLHSHPYKEALKVIAKTNSDEVQIILESKPTIESATLWLELFGMPFQNSVFLEVAIRSSLDKGVSFQLDAVTNGQADHILRWYALGGNTGAALHLYRNGNREFALLASGLSNGLSGYGEYGKYNAEIVNALHDLVATKGSDGIKWLVLNSHGNDHLYGASDGYWQLLLSLLLEADHPEPHLLRHSLEYLGCFTLPRVSAVRRDFRELLIQHPEYRIMLEEALYSFSNNRRQGAARVLLTCYPETAILAAEIIIHDAGKRSFREEEWLRFCTKLSLGTVVLDHIEQMLSTLSGLNHAYALALLFRNGRVLSDQQYQELVISLLGDGYWIDMPEMSEIDNGTYDSILNDQIAYKYILVALEQGNLDERDRAARKLVTYHRELLTEDQYGIALAYVYRNSHSLDSSEVIATIDHAFQEPSIVRAIETESKEIRRQTGHEPAIYTYLLTKSQPEVWRDLLWNGLTESYSHRGEFGFMLLSLGRDKPDVGKLIGRYSYELLVDSGVPPDGRHSHAIPWLAFLADEFHGIDSVDFENAIQVVHRIGADECLRALIARLGDIPADFVTGKSNEWQSLTDLKRPPTLTELIFTEIMRDGADLTYFAEFLIQQLLYSMLPREVLVAATDEGIHGTLFSSFIEFVTGQLDHYEGIAKLIGSGVIPRFWRDEATPWYELRSMLNVVSDDRARREEYVKALQIAVKGGFYNNTIGLYSEILRADYQCVASHDIVGLLEEIRDPYAVDWETAHRIAGILGKIKDDHDIIAALHRAVNAFNSLSNPDHDIRGEVAGLVFALSLMKQENKASQAATRLFLKSLTGILLIYPMKQRGKAINQQKSFDALNILSVVAPLLDVIPVELLQQCIVAGLAADEPDIRTCCRVLHGFVNAPLP